jgi:hypothetical protein
MGRRQAAIGTLVEHWSRYVMLFPLPDGNTAESVRAGLAEAIQRLPDHLWQSLTWDQGKEMAEHARFTRAPTGRGSSRASGPICDLLLDHSAERCCLLRHLDRYRG